MEKSTLCGRTKRTKRLPVGRKPGYVDFRLNSKLPCFNKTLEYFCSLVQNKGYDFQEL
jgi:hypothetical protein